MPTPPQLTFFVAAPWQSLAPSAGPRAFARLWNAEPEGAQIAIATVPQSMGAFGDEQQVKLSGPGLDLRRVEKPVRTCLQALADHARADTQIDIAPMNQLDGTILLRVTIQERS